MKNNVGFCGTGCSVSFINEDDYLLEMKPNGTFRCIAENSKSGNYDDRLEERKPFNARAERIASIKAKQKGE